MSIPQQLPVWRTVAQAYGFVWDQKYQFIKFAFLPSVLFMIGDGIDLMPLLNQTVHGFGAESGWLTILLAMISSSAKGLFLILIIAAFSIVWHRQFLVSSTTQRLQDLIYWRKRHAKFVMAAIVFGCVGFILSLPVAWLVGPLVSIIVDAKWVGASGIPPFYFFVIMGGVAVAATAVIGALLSSRWCLIFPSIAVDEFISFRQSWQASSGNGLRLTGIIILSTLPIQGAAYILFKAFPLWESLMVWMPFIVLLVFLEVISYFVITAIGVSALSAAYQHLRRTPEAYTDMFPQK